MVAGSLALAKNGHDLAGTPAARAGFAFGAAACVLALSSLALVGWVSDHVELAALLPSMPTMKANTAICFIALSIGLAAYARLQSSTARRWVTAGLLAAGLIAGATLIEYITGVDLGLDQALLADRATDPGAYPGRMAPATAAAIVLLSAALPLARRAPSRWRPLPALLALTIGYLSSLGLLFGANWSLGLGYPFTTVSLPTAACVVLLSAAALSLTPWQGTLLGMAVAGNAGGVFLRRALPLLTLLPAALLLAQHLAQRYGWWSSATGLAAGAALLTAALLLLVVRAAQGFNTIEAELRASRATLDTMLADVINSASDAVVSTDRAGRMTLFNPAAERIFGYRQSAALGNPLELVLVPERTGDDETIDDAGAGVSRWRMGAGRVRGLRSDGAELQLEASISRVTVNGSPVDTAILRDVTERVRTERALMQYQLELTELTQQLMAQEKATTSRLAQALHEQLGQTLAAIRIDFVCEASLADAAQAARHVRVDRLIDQAIREVRRILEELRPTLLDERGLVEALDNELRTRRRSAEGVRLVLEAPAELAAQRWSADVEYAAFMVAREAIANALHARATLVRVCLAGGAGGLRLEVNDNGDGLAPGSLATRSGDLGMVGMRERAIAIGARVEVQAPPAGGTSVRLTWSDANE